MAAYDCRSNVHGEPVEYTGPDLNFGEVVSTAVVECAAKGCQRRFIVIKYKRRQGRPRRLCVMCEVKNQRAAGGG